MRFSQPGFYGQGIYFADNAEYSDVYSYGFKCPKTGLQLKQMLLVFVIVGEACELKVHDRSLRLPPLKSGSKTDRFDSVYDPNSRHTVIYENTKQLPAYLVTYY